MSCLYFVHHHITWSWTNIWRLFIFVRPVMNVVHLWEELILHQNNFKHIPKYFLAVKARCKWGLPALAFFPTTASYLKRHCGHLLETTSAIKHANKDGTRQYNHCMQRIHNITFSKKNATSRIYHTSSLM